MVLCLTMMKWSMRLSLHGKDTWVNQVFSNLYSQHHSSISATSRFEYSLGALRESFYGAKLPDNLCQYMVEPASRQRLKRALLDKFVPNWNDNEDTWMVAESEIKYKNPDKKDSFWMVA